MTALELAIFFHDTYERLAPDFGYETRQDTKAFSPSSKNGRLMVAVCCEVLNKLGAWSATDQPSPAPYVPEIVASCASNIEGNKGNCLICGTPVTVFWPRAADNG